MKGLSAFLVLLGVSMVANAISGKWAFDRSKEGGDWVALDLLIAAGFFMGSVILWKAAERRYLARRYASLDAANYPDDGGAR